MTVISPYEYSAKVDEVGVARADGVSILTGLMEGYESVLQLPAYVSGPVQNIKGLTRDLLANNPDFVYEPKTNTYAPNADATAKLDASVPNTPKYTQQGMG